MKIKKITYGNKISFNVGEVLESYKVFLEVKYPDYYSSYKNRIKSNIDGARLEAIAFSIFRNEFNFEVNIKEDLSTGGADFICSNDRISFIVEVTSIDNESLENISGLKNIIDDKAKSFSMISKKLNNIAKGKAKQLSGSNNLPTILLIGSMHVCSDLLLGTRAAELLMIPEKLSVSIKEVKNDNHKVKIISELESSVFFRIKKNSCDIEPCRKSISAIVLLSVYSDSVDMVGILHPKPSIIFNYNILHGVPFLKIKNWPIENGIIEKQWIINRPNPKRIYLFPINFKNNELKNK
ncbi:MAG: hypothetical protein ACYDIA_25220 [Candidatus Humimicrobiaceae bacterium]